MPALRVLLTDGSSATTAPVAAVATRLNVTDVLLDVFAIG